MITYLMIFQAIVAVLIVLLVLVQFGKGAEAGLISGGGSGEVFSGSVKGNILVKITVVLSVIFLGNSVYLAKLQSQYASASLLDSQTPVTAQPLNNDAAKKVETPAVAAPTPTAPVVPAAAATPAAPTQKP